MYCTHSNDQQGPRTGVVVDNMYAERESLSRSHNMTDEYILRGQATLESLQSQRSVLKQIQRKILDVGNTLGISQSLLSVIERRTTVDNMIFWGGMYRCCVLHVQALYLYCY